MSDIGSVLDTLYISCLTAVRKKDVVSHNLYISSVTSEAKVWQQKYCNFWLKFDDLASSGVKFLVFFFSDTSFDTSLSSSGGIGWTHTAGQIFMIVDCVSPRTQTCSMIRVSILFFWFNFFALLLNCNSPYSYRSLCSTLGRRFHRSLL